MANIIRIYKVDCTTEDRTDVLSLEELQKIVGGYVELFRANNKLSIACDEDGRFKGYYPCITYNSDIRKVDFCGTIVVGKFTEDGMVPVSEELIEQFELNSKWGWH